LFDPNNRSLAVTSLLNSPYTYQDISSLSLAGNLRNLSSNKDITQDLSYRVDTRSDGTLQIDITNSALGNYVGSVYYDLS